MLSIRRTFLKTLTLFPFSVLFAGRRLVKKLEEKQAPNVNELVTVEVYRFGRVENGAIYTREALADALAKPRGSIVNVYTYDEVIRCDFDVSAACRKDIVFLQLMPSALVATFRADPAKAYRIWSRFDFADVVNCGYAGVSEITKCEILGLVEHDLETVAE